MARLPANVYKRADGTYRKRFTFNGKSYDVYARTVQELPEKEQAKRQELESGMYVENKKLTLDKYFEHWKQEHAKTVKGATLHQHKLIYNAHLSPTFGARKVQKIERREIVEWQNNMLTTGHTATTANKALVLLKAMLNDAVLDEVLSVNPAATVKALRIEKKKAAETIHRALTVEEQALFLQKMRKSYYYEFVALLLCSGMRTGEAAALTWSDIDLKKGLIHINKTVTSDADGNTIIGSPKTKASIRDIPITESIKSILKQAREKQAEIYGNTLLMTNRVFNSPYGKFVATSPLNRAIKIAIDALNRQGHHIEPIAAHALRDTFATRFIEQGGTLHTLKAILGHASLAMTADLYAHVLHDTKQKEMNSVTFILPK